MAWLRIYEDDPFLLNIKGFHSFTSPVPQSQVGKVAGCRTGGRSHTGSCAAVLPNTGDVHSRPILRTGWQANRTLVTQGHIL